VLEIKWGRAMDVEGEDIEDCFAVDEWNFQNSQHRFDEDSEGGSSGELQRDGKPTWCGTE